MTNQNEPTPNEYDAVLGGQAAQPAPLKEFYLVKGRTYKGVALYAVETIDPEDGSTDYFITGSLQSAAKFATEREAEQVMNRAYTPASFARIDIVWYNAQGYKDAKIWAALKARKGQ